LRYKVGQDEEEHNDQRFVNLEHKDWQFVANGKVSEVEFEDCSQTIGFRRDVQKKNHADHPVEDFGPASFVVQKFGCFLQEVKRDLEEDCYLHKLLKTLQDESKGVILLGECKVD
jgi:hypothetical protein